MCIMRGHWQLALAALLLSSRPAQGADPRHQRDARCPGNVSVDASSLLRQCRSCGYLTVPLAANATVADCAYACCGDWSCQTFIFHHPSPPQPPPSGPSAPLNGSYVNYDSLRGASGVVMSEDSSGALVALSTDPRSAFWTRADGRRVDATSIFLCFDCSGGSSSNNRTGVISPDGMNISLSRLPFDPQGWTQVFARQLGGGNASCVFQDDIPPPQPAAGTAVSGVRAFLPGQTPPFPASTFFASVALNSTAIFAADGDEFPMAWASDGNLYAGAGDNTQPSRGIPQRWNSPASMFRVSGRPGDAGFPDNAFNAQGSPFAPANSSFAKANCPKWGGGLANIKSSGVLFVNNTLFWACSCFNYGDDPAFNRQRYGPAWIVRSHDFGVTWDDVDAPVFAGRLAAPRFISAGKAYEDSPDGYVYVYFPGTDDDAAFFEQNDAIWLGRVPIDQIWDRSAYEFFVGLGGDGSAQWDSDDTLAAPVLSWPLRTSVQEANYHPLWKRYIFANWAWISASTQSAALSPHPPFLLSDLHPLRLGRFVPAPPQMDGYPRPDHSPDERNARTARQRTQLVLFESPTPWGPFSVFHRDDNWMLSDGSSGAYTPVFAPAWLDATGGYMVSTQCCGTPEFPPDNHYSFNYQRLDVVLA